MKIFFFLNYLICILTFTLFGQQNEKIKSDSEIYNLNDFALYNKYRTYLKETPIHVVNGFFFKAFTEDKLIAITFDDGPVNNTNKIISFLDKKNIPATFFLVANKLNHSNSSLYSNKLFDVGHHTYSHLDYRELNKNKMRIDIDSCLTIFKRYGLSSNLFRPAYGVVNHNIYQALIDKKLNGVLWSLDSQDWNSQNIGSIIHNTLDNLKKGDVILFHDSINIYILKEIINGIQERGYKIIPLKDLMSIQ